MNTDDAVFARHRGPYSFHVVRPTKRPGFHKGEWLPGYVDGADAETEARALLADPRDTIVCVCVWSTYESQFVTTFNKEERAA